SIICSLGRGSSSDRCFYLVLQPVFSGPGYESQPDFCLQYSSLSQFHLAQQSEMEHSQHPARGASRGSATHHPIPSQIGGGFGSTSWLRHDPWLQLRHFFIVLLGLATLFEAVSSLTDRLVSLIQGSLLMERMYDMLHTKSAEVDLEYY